MIDSSTPGVWVIKTAQTIPDSELWLHQPEASARLDRAMAAMGQPPLAADLDLDKPDAWAVLKTLRLLQAMNWDQLQSSKGLRWELIQSRRGAAGERLFSLRISRTRSRLGLWLRREEVAPQAFAASQVAKSAGP